MNRLQVKERSVNSMRLTLPSGQARRAAGAATVALNAYNYEILSRYGGNGAGHGVFAH
jgi:hypothetical protein